MRYMPAGVAVTAHQARLLSELGERVRQARLRRGLSQVSVAAGAGITRPTLSRFEAGAPSATLGTLIRVLSVLGLEGEIAMLARGLAHPSDTPATAPANVKAGHGTAIRISQYPVLSSIAWHISEPDAWIAREEALALYERNWKHVDPAVLNEEEARLLEDLKLNEGKGVLLV